MSLNLKEKIYGFMAGGAVGDALGLGTEFMTRVEAARRYPGGLRRYSDIVRDSHRRQWKRGQWTNDTETLLLLADSLSECGRIDHKDYARRLKDWVESDPVDMLSALRWITRDKDYTEHPVEVCRAVREKMNMDEASNEALGRAVLIGIWPGSADKEAIDHCSLTHPDTRCTGTSVIVAAVARSLMWQDKEPDYEELESLSKRTDTRILPYLRTARRGELDDLELDDEETLWYSRKSMAAALWALWHCDSPEEILHVLVDAAGDADTNAQLGLSLAGIKYGFSALPAQYIDELTDRDLLLEKAARLLQAVETAADNR